MRTSSPYHNPTQWTTEVETYLIKILEFYVKRIEKYAENFKKDFNKNKQSILEETYDANYANYDSDMYMDQFYEVYEGFDGSTYALENIFEDHLPSLIRSSAFISLYSALEIEIHKLCEIIRDKENYNIRSHDLKGRGIPRSLNYLEKVACMPIDKNSELWKAFFVIQKIRNLIVHSDGQIDTDESGSLQLIKSFDNIQGLKLKHGQTIIFKQGFLNYVIELMNKIVENIGELLENKYRGKT